MDPLAPDLAGLLPTRTTSVEETRAVGRRLAGLLPLGSVLALEGDLGAGKTELVRGLVSGLGGDASDVTSPTFTIANEYPVEGGVALHVDAYRANSEREFVEMGLPEILDDAAMAAIEWPDRMGRLLPPEAIVIRMTHLSPTDRRIEISPSPGSGRVRPLGPGT